MLSYLFKLIQKVLTCFRYLRPAPRSLIRTIWITCARLLKDAQRTHSMEITGQMICPSWPRTQVTWHAAFQLCPRTVNMSSCVFVKQLQVVQKTQWLCRLTRTFHQSNRSDTFEIVLVICKLTYFYLFCPSQDLEDVKDRLVTISEQLDLCQSVLNDLKDLSDLLVVSSFFFLDIWHSADFSKLIMIYIFQRKSLQDVTLPQKKWPEVDQSPPLFLFLFDLNKFY